MGIRTLLAVLTALVAMPTSAMALTYDLSAYDDNQHGLWLPTLGHTDLLFDAGSTLEVDDAAGNWFLDGTVTSRTNPSVRYIVDLDFTGALSGEDSKIKGNVWANQEDEWRFARNVSGTIERVGGSTYEVMRNGGGNDYRAQVGTGLNDKNNDFGISTWIKLDGDGCRDFGCGGDINGKLGAKPVPEPSAALVFALGMSLVGGATRRRN